MKNSANSQIYLGLMSGTSIDAIDAAAVNFTDSSFTLLGTHSESIPDELKKALADICQPNANEINRLGQLDRQLGFLFAKACQSLLDKLNIAHNQVTAIGSHGQTIRHQPYFQHPFTLQIGDPNVIAEVTGITTVADFRRRDLACGGQGAPLTPAFHQFAFQKEDITRIIVNIGGIANLTFLPSDSSKTVIGFDSGPGNTLIDSWIRKHKDHSYDRDGNWAKLGRININLFNRLLQDNYFHLAPPKSTGREYFNICWLEEKLRDLSVNPQDVQCTLAELSAHTIMDAVNQLTTQPSEILLCGGGVHNQDLVSRLSAKKGQHQLFTTQEFGVNPDWVEAIAFAWLARQTLNRLPGNLPAVTGATKPVILGGIYMGRE